MFKYTPKFRDLCEFVFDVHVQCIILKKKQIKKHSDPESVLIREQLFTGYEEDSKFIVPRNSNYFTRRMIFKKSNTKYLLIFYQNVMQC